MKVVIEAPVGNSVLKYMLDRFGSAIRSYELRGEYLTFWMTDEYSSKVLISYCINLQSMGELYNGTVYSENVVDLEDAP